MRTPAHPTDPKSILAATARVPDHVARRAFEEETLLLNLDTGQYHSLNVVGGRMLELLAEHTGTVGDVVERIAREYGRSPEELAPELASFCRELADRGLIELAEVADPPGRR